MGYQISRVEEFVKKADKKLSFWGIYGSKYYDPADLLHKTANCFKLDKSLINLFTMGDEISTGEELVKKAEEKLNGWGIFGSNYYDAADLLHKAANCFELAKSWDRVGAVYVKLASCHLKLDSKHETARAYVTAADYYKKTNNSREAISCLEQAAHMFLGIERLNAATGYYEEIAKLYEKENNLELAMIYYQKTADLFQSQDLTSSANQCRQKIAEYSAKVEKYQRSIAMFEEIARYSIRNNLLKYGVRGHLLNAGICQLCRGDVVAINNALERYQILDPTFSGTRECKFLMDLAAAIDEEDVAKFTDCLKEYDSTIKLDEWRTPVLLKVKEALKAKELKSMGRTLKANFANQLTIDHRSSSICTGKKIKKSMQQQETCQFSVIWRGKKFSLEMDPTATLKSLGDELLNLTNVRDDTMRLIVPTNKSSRLLYPFSEEHSFLKLEATSILEGKSIRMLGVPKDEVDDILQSAKADLRILGFDEEEKRSRQRISNGLQSSLKLPQGPYVFCDFRTLHLPRIELNPPASKALKLMHKLAADPGIVAIMNKHRWRVGIMTEMAPEGYVGVSPECILGFNKNHGEEISLRLRTDDLKGFRKYDSIKKTLLHELAHMVHSEHDVKFYALLKQLNEEAAKLDWTRSTGHTLSGHNLQHYEDDEDNDNRIGLSHKLGGQTSVFNVRASSVAAAYSRLAQASTIPSEAIEMHQASNTGDSLQSSHVDALLEKQLNDVKVESLEKHNGVFSADVPSDDRRESEPDPDDYETGSPMKYEPHIELDSDDHKMRNHPPPLEAKLSEEPDPDDCSAEKHKTGSPTSLEPDPDEHSMGIERKVTAGQNSHVSLGHSANEEERGSLTHTDQDGFPEGVKLGEPYTNDTDIIPDGVSSTVIDEPDPDDQELDGVSSTVIDEPDPDDQELDGVSSTVIDEPDPDDQELQRIQDPVAIICSRLQKAISVLRSQANPLEASRVVQTILKIIRNAIEHPDEVKFRKLRKANPLIQRDVVSYPAAIEILSVVGFSEDTVIDDTGRTEAYLVLKRNDPGLLWLAKSSLETSIA